MKILLLGSNGFIGRWIEAGLTTAGHDVTALDYPKIDLTVSPEVFSEWLDSYDLPATDVLINCVGINGAQQSFSELRHFFQLNGFAAIHIRNLIKRLGCETFIHISSETVLGSGEDIDESAAMAPAHPYAFSKGMFEAYMLADPVFDEIASVALRLPIITGTENSIASALDFIKEDFAKGGPVLLFGDGSHRRKFLAVSDVANVVDTCINHCGAGFQVLHAPGIVLSMMDIYEQLCSMHGQRPELVFRAPKTESQVSTIISRTSDIFADCHLSGVL